MDERDPVLDVVSLKVEFSTREGQVRAVEDLSFELFPDETLAIVGESGCGKSVTAQAVLNVLPRNGRVVSGQIRYRRDAGVVEIQALDPDGKEMRSIQGREVAMIFQEPMTAFSPVHTIGSQIDEMIELHMPRPESLGRRQVKGWVREQTIAILRKVGMPSPEEIVDSYPHNLSGGMRQRAMIAMALSCNPRILVADEPTTALDVTLQAQVLGLMRQMITDFHTSVIFITHDLGVVAEIANRVVVMYLGRVVESAPVDDLFYAPRHPYTQALIRSVPRTSGAIEKLVPIEGTVPSPLDMPDGCSFHTRCAFAMPGLCDVRIPELREVGEGHRVACFLHEPEVMHDRA